MSIYLAIILWLGIIYHAVKTVFALEELSSVEFTCWGCGEGEKETDNKACLNKIQLNNENKLF